MYICFQDVVHLSQAPYIQVQPQTCRSQGKRPGVVSPDQVFSVSVHECTDKLGVQSI